MTLKEYDNVVGGQRDPFFGILQTEVSHHKYARWAGGQWVNHHTVTNGKSKDTQWKKENKKLATSRTIYYQFKIRKGAPLAEYGVAVVYDNQSKNHISLVRLNDFFVEGDWRYHHGLKVVLPYDCFIGIDKCQGDLDSTNRFLEENVFNTRSNEPEILGIEGGKAFVLPKVKSGETNNLCADRISFFYSPNALFLVRTSTGRCVVFTSQPETRSQRRTFPTRRRK